MQCYYKSILLFVRLSNAGIVSKRMDIIVTLFPQNFFLYRSFLILMVKKVMKIGPLLMKLS